MAANWSLLPTDVLGAIAMKLETIEDFVYFSAVCYSWNHASSSLKHLWKAATEPWLLLAENNKENPDSIRKVFNLRNNKCYKLNLPETFGARCWGSPYGMVAMVRRDLSVQLFNPVTNVKFHFPSCETLPHYPPEHFDVVEGSEDYYHWFLRIILLKLIVVKVYNGDHHEFVITILYDTSKLAFARHGDQSWTPVLIQEKHLNPMVDLVTMDNYVYGLYDDGTMVYWKVMQFLGAEPVKPKDFAVCQSEYFFQGKWLEETYLVQSGSDLLMVVRHKDEVTNSDGDDYNYDIVYQTVVFEVYKLNSKDKRWEQTGDVGDVALIVGCNCSMSASVTSAKYLQPNCIYFTDDENNLWHRPTGLGGHDMGVFDIKSGEISRFYEGDDLRSSFCPPFWFIPDFFL